MIFASCAALAAFAFFLSARASAGGAVESWDGAGGLEFGAAGVLSCSEDFRALLRAAQLRSLPQNEPFAAECGAYWLAPGDEETARIARGLSSTGWGGAWVRISEDALTRETVLENACGEELSRLPAEEGCRASRAFKAPAPSAEDASESDYDPSRVSALLFLAPVFWEDWGTVASGGDVRPRDSANPASGSGGAPSSASRDESNGLSAASSAYFAGHPPLGGTNEASVAESPASRIVHVDSARGNDAWTGKRRAPAGGFEGPKRGVSAGMSAVQDGGGLLVHAGVYGESLNVRGRNVVARFDGDVIFKRTSPPPAASVPDAAAAPTNGVAMASREQ